MAKPKADLNKALYYYPWYFKDWRSSRSVSRMTLAERGLYRELLDECWDKGSISDDPEVLADIVDCSLDEFNQCWERVQKCFVRARKGFLKNLKLELVREETQTMRQKRVDSANERWETKGKGGDASAFHLESKCNPNGVQVQSKWNAIKEDKRKEDKIKSNKIKKEAPLVPESGAEAPDLSESSSYQQEQERQGPAAPTGKPWWDHSKPITDVHGTDNNIPGSKTKGKPLDRLLLDIPIADEEPMVFWIKAYEAMCLMAPGTVRSMTTDRDKLDTVETLLDAFIVDNPCWASHVIAGFRQYIELQPKDFHPGPVKFLQDGGAYLMELSAKFTFRLSIPVFLNEEWRFLKFTEKPPYQNNYIVSPLGTYWEVSESSWDKVREAITHLAEKDIEYKALRSYVA